MKRWSYKSEQEWNYIKMKVLFFRESKVYKISLQLDWDEKKTLEIKSLTFYTTIKPNLKKYNPNSADKINRMFNFVFFCIKLIIMLR